jgi:LPXTG-motif cell wall-anchored protein
LADPLTHEYDAGDQGCGSKVPGVRWTADCHGKVLLEVTNRWPQPLTDLAFSRGDDIGTRFSVASKTWRQQLFTGLREGEPLGGYWAMDSPGRPLVQWFQVAYKKHVSCDWTPPVSLTPTCDGVHVVTTNTEKRSTLIISWRASLTHFDEVEFEMAQGSRLDVHVPLPRDGAVRAGWAQPWDLNGAGGPVGGLMIRNRAKDCAVPAPPVDGAGRLPVTGIEVGVMAIVGAVLLALGTALVTVMRRRRTVA